MKKIILLIFIVLSVPSYADPVSEIRSCIDLPITMYGISIDKSTREMNEIHYDCHIDFESSTITSYMEAYADTELADSLKLILLEHYTFYNPLFEGMNTVQINLFGESLFGKGCPVYHFFKAEMMNRLGQYAYTYKIEDKIPNDFRAVFKIWNTRYSNNPNYKLYYTISIVKSDLEEVINLLKLHCDPFEIEKKKFEMQRGIEMNKDALPVDFGLGTKLVAIETEGYESTYKCYMSDFLVNMSSTDDLKSSIRQIQLACETTRDQINFKDCKGFGLLGMKLTYSWFKESDGTKVASVTFGFPSLQIIDIWPEELTDMLTPIAYTEDIETSSIPIVLEEVVDLGLGGNIKWSSCNLGANKPEDFGNYYGFGDGSGKKRTRDNKDYQLPQNMSSFSGDKKYDPAKRMKGERWHTPTIEEWKAMFENCLRIETVYQGVKGLKVIGWNGNAIFLPYAGFRDGDRIFEETDSGCYWSSSLTNNKDAQNLYLKNAWVITAYEQKYRGLSIRPVREY